MRGKYTGKRTGKGGITYDGKQKKYQIFISSTFKDLKIARLKVRDAILSMYHFPVGMEMFGALDEDQWE